LAGDGDDGTAVTVVREIDHLGLCHLGTARRRRSADADLRAGGEVGIKRSGGGIFEIGTREADREGGAGTVDRALPTRGWGLARGRAEDGGGAAEEQQGEERP